jgi:hypothetical protein
MNLKEAAEAFGIPANIISRMEKEGLICLPLDDAGKNALSVLSRLWGQSWFIGAFIMSIKHSRERTMLLLFPGYDKIDRYILNTFLGEPDMKCLSTDLLKYRVKRAFAAQVDGERIRYLRRMAASIRLKKKKLVLGKLTLTYAELLGV